MIPPLARIIDDRRLRYLISVELLFPIAEPEPGVRLQRLYDLLATRFGFDPARVRVSRRKLTGGEILCGPPHRITISGHLAPDEQEDTLRHEAAHAWAWRVAGPNAGHGVLFRRLAETLGASRGGAPETPALREFRAQGARYVYHCDGCGRLFRRFRPFRGARECLACHRTGRPARLRRVETRRP
jgi:predicted SprT family Zn-dependent metalloprotease